MTFKKDSFSVENKVIVITGASGILGSSYVEAFCDRGAHVALCDSNREAIESLALKIREKTGTNTQAFPVDLRKKDSIIECIRTMVRTYGSIDVLINNAATKPPGFFSALESYALETWEEVMSVNVTAIFLTLQALAPIFLEQGFGSVINIASIYGVVGPDPRIYEGSWYEDLGGSINTPLVYAASKGAVISMTRYLAAVWGPKNIRVNCVTPGGVSSGQNEIFERQYSARVPMGRMAQSDEILGALLYLASDASSYVTGQNIIVDGGWTVW